jgi:hypothetical protein
LRNLGRRAPYKRGDDKDKPAGQNRKPKDTGKRGENCDKRQQKKQQPFPPHRHDETRSCLLCTRRHDNPN